MELVFDWTRPLSVKEREAFTARRRRLAQSFGTSATEATKALNSLAPLAEGLAVRHAFSYLSKPTEESPVSDRQAPERSQRPSATRISSSQGVALRLYLAALAVAQATNKPGMRAQLPDLAIAEFGQDVGWTDVVATKSVASGSGRSLSVIRDKKARSVGTALNTLNAAGLVELRGGAGLRGRYHGFTLLHEGGRQLIGDPRPYLVPAVQDGDWFRLPAGFVSEGWIHVLEDSEITVLLMVACGKGAFPPGIALDINDGEVAIPAAIRLCQYGIHRDPFSTALKTLKWFGLLNVRELGRHEDGRAEDGEVQLHRLKLVPGGFDVPALEKVRSVVAEQLQR